MSMFSKLKVLIADDAPIVIASLRSMLLKLGFSDDNVFHTKSPKACIYAASRELFDIFICDYNFGKGLNGKQTFEELKHYKLLKDDAVFILVTAESSAAVVRSIVELKPDEYILKPFNISRLKERISAAICRKRALQRIYSADLQGDAELGLQACDDLEPFHPEYYFIIQKFRGEFLSKLERYDKAKVVYEDTLERKSLDWAKIGLANALKNTGKEYEAAEIINSMLAETPHNPSVRLEAASISLFNKDIPDAIRHLSLASSIVPGNSERELVIANLCLSVGDSAAALEHYKYYVEINKETYRNNTFSRLNFIRMHLYDLRSEEPDKKEKRLLEVKSLLRELYNDEQSGELLNQLELVAAHIAMEENQFAYAVSILNKLYKTKQFHHFYDYYHFTWLLNIMSYDSEFTKAINWCHDSLVKNESEILFESNIALAASLKQAHADKLKWLEEKYLALQDEQLDIETLLNLYMEILNRCPTLRTVCLKVVTILSRYWPQGMGFQQVEKIVERCDNTIRQLMSEEELKKIAYQQLYDSVLQHKNIQLDS
ncbi:response regulator [Vibrio aestuarianus]|uniref:Response regulator VieB n=2 Tax=Vibrio aestuarianus TaxID=28171 RepID=A0ABN8TQZ9_9VIBR|nr:tetratricopeptide repeat-containing response regulator [Vibrio aestuarianus]MDE1256493.1 response regulator [Vibrio aestuarianus]CAH8225902.1 Response regulator VieB [Vibrio aestuarianus]